MVISQRKIKHKGSLKMLEMVRLLVSGARDEQKSSASHYENHFIVHVLTIWNLQ